MTQNLQQEIEKELTTFSGQTFSSSEEVLEWLDKAFNRIAEKTIEAMRVEEITEDNHNISQMEYITMGFEHTQGRVQGYNQAVAEQNKKASAWLGKDN